MNDKLRKKVLKKGKQGEIKEIKTRFLQQRKEKWAGMLIRLHKMMGKQGSTQRTACVDMRYRHAQCQ